MWSNKSRETLGFIWIHGIKHIIDGISEAIIMSTLVNTNLGMVPLLHTNKLYNDTRLQQIIPDI